MADDISGFGTSVRLLASNTFPTGFEVTQFADDSDPLDLPDLTIAEGATGLNGDFVSWTSANPIPMTLNVIASSDDDKNLALLFEANRAGRNKTSAKDTILAIVTYADGQVATLTVGRCMVFQPGKSISSEGRLKSRPYQFMFENQVIAG